MILNEDAVFSKSCKNPVYIVLMNGKSPLSSIILKATGDYFSHACIAFNDDLDPLYSFGAKSKTMQKGGMGFCISKPTDLSVFNKQAYYAVYVTYVTDEAYAKMKERLSYFTTNANKMIYDYVGLLNVWMHQSSDNRTRAYFCSRFVMDIIGAGIKLDKLPSLYRPQDIANMNNISLVNRGFDFHNYDKKITQKNEKLLKQGKLNPDDIIFESNILNESDIYYNKDKFDSGETNLCFVTGLSGSGKSTMANGMKAEYYGLDDVGFNWNFSDDNLKDYGDLIYTFFKGIGKKYRVGYAEVDDSYTSIYSDFVNYSIQYAKAHKNIKFVIEGVQLFQWINPKDLVDYAVYIKGTSRLISTYRAAKRNAGFENNTKDKINAIKKQVMGDLKYGKDFESRLKTWRKFFTNMQKKNIHEDVSSVIQKDFKSKHDMNLSQFEKMRLSDAAIQVYKQKLPSLSHVRINNNTKGYIWIDKKTDMPAAIVNVEEKDDGFTWIQAFEIFVPYKGHGLSKDILNVAIRELKATNLSVNKDNQVAIKIYKSYGFKTYKTTEYMYFMSIDKNAFDDDDDEDIYDESAIMKSAILESNNSSHFYFYHLLPKGSNISPGIVSLDYQYHHDIQEFRKNSDKYRERLCNEWGIYSGKSPASLSDKEIYDGINKFRKSSQGCNQIYLFRYPPTTKLGKQMGEILKFKDIYRVDLNELRDNGVITDVDFGYIDSNTDNTKLSEDWYINISYDDYFKNYTESDPNRLLFSYMNHISVTPKNGYISKRFLTKIKQSDLSHIDESAIMESVSPKIYFLSESNMDGKTLLPRIPSNYMTKNGYEESKTPRVCFSTSIDGSLMGLSQNLKGKELYVHIPESEVNIYKPSVKQVPDCKITGEVWVKDKVNIKCIGKIKVIKDKGLPGHRYMYGDGKSAELYDWDWKWEEKYSVNESVIIESYNPHYTYSKLSSQKEISDFKNSMKIVFNSNDNPTDKLIKSMKKIEDNGTVIGYIGFSSYKIDGKKYLGIGNFMVLPQYQSKGYGANIITDIININKNKYDEIYCYVEESNTRAISFYKRVSKVGHLTDYGYYVTLYSSKSHVNESIIEDFEIEAETGFYDKHNRWNPIVIINGEQYRHRVECLIMRQNKLFVAKSNTGVLLIPGGGVDKSLSDEEQVYNECKEEARILVENIKPTGYAYLRRTGVSESAKRLPKEQQWVGSYTEIYIADYAKDFTGFIDYCDRDSEIIRGDFRPISEIIDKLVPEWKQALIDANYISVATEALKSYKDPKLALKRRMGIKRNNAVKLGDFSNVAKSAPTPQAQTISVPSPAVSSSAPSQAKPAQTTEETKEIPETVKANANRLLCKEIASYPKFSGCYYNMDYPLYNGNGHAIVGWKMTGVHYNDFDSFNMHRDRIYEYCSKIFEDTNPGYGLKMDKKTNCIYITEI